MFSVSFAVSHAEDVIKLRELRSECLNAMFPHEVPLVTEAQMPPRSPSCGQNTHVTVYRRILRENPIKSWVETLTYVQGL